MALESSLYPNLYTSTVKFNLLSDNIIIGQGVEIIIALGHSGYEKDQEIAKKVPEIDVVVGGHSNTFLYHGDPPKTNPEEKAGDYPTLVQQDGTGGKTVPVVQAYAYTKYLGKLKLTFSDDGTKLKSWTGNPILLDNSSYVQGQLATSNKV